MAKYVVTVDLCIEVEDVDTEEAAKVAAIEQFGDYLKHNTLFDLLKAEKMSE